MPSNQQVLSRPITNVLSHKPFHVSLSCLFCSLPSLVTYLTLLNTMSTSVEVTILPSMMPQSLHSLEKFLLLISTPLLDDSPKTANRLNVFSASDAMINWRWERTVGGETGGRVKREGREDWEVRRIGVKSESATGTNPLLLVPLSPLPTYYS